MTMIVATHEIGLACEIGDTMVFLDQGVIIEQGNPRQMLTRLADTSAPATSWQR